VRRVESYHTSLLELVLPLVSSGHGFSLGSDKTHDNSNEEHYWEAMKDTIYRGVLAGLRLHYRPLVIFVFGESSRDPKFGSILEDALRRLLGEVPEILDEDPHFSNSTGGC
jgi:hypothetical protein